jgi:hypothetical protein
MFSHHLLWYLGNACRGGHHDHSDNTVNQADLRFRRVRLLLVLLPCMQLGCTTASHRDDATTAERARLYKCGATPAETNKLSDCVDVSKAEITEVHRAALDRVLTLVRSAEGNLCTFWQDGSWGCFVGDDFCACVLTPDGPDCGCEPRTNDTGGETD